MKQEIMIERLAYGGEGIGRLQGKVCFVEGALPGETVLADLVQDKKKFLRAKAVKILSPSPHRLEPPCPFYNECGGCQYQHLQYSEELRWKEIQVREYLERNLQVGPEKIKTIVPSPKEYGYRSSLTLHRGGKSKNGAFGFFAKDNETVIPVSECLLAAPELQKVFKENFSLPEARDVTFRLSKGKVVSNCEDRLFEMNIGDETLFTHSQGFFQNNLEVTALIANRLEGWVGEIEPEAFIDLYAGAGTFSLLAASSVPTLVCAEENPRSLKALEENLKNKNRQAVVLKGKVEKEVPAWLEKSPPEKAMVFADPPRTGMAASFTRFLSRKPEIKNLVYLSCHLGTLTRDLGNLLAEGKWQLAEAIPFDMFPRTKHIEILVRLTREA